MRIDIITVLPELLRSPFDHSILKRAIDKGLVEVNLINLRDYSTHKQKKCGRLRIWRRRWNGYEH